MKLRPWWVLIAGLGGFGMGCDDGASDAPVPDAAAPASDGAVPDQDPTVDAAPMADADAPPSLQAVAGELTYATYEGGAGHIYSVFADGSLRQRVTPMAGAYTHHAVGPDPRFVAALRHAGYDAEGRPDAATPAEVWIIDVRDRRAYPLSPPGCDAAQGGVGWQNDTLVMFALSCDGAPAVAYLYPFDAESRDRDLLLPVTDHPDAVRDVFPVVNTSIFAYAVDGEVCAGGRCVTKPAIWIAEYDTGLRCRLTDGDPTMLDLTTIDGGERRLGDRWPAFNRDLGGLTFSRSVAGKPPGPGGHFDLFRVGIDQRLFFDDDREPAQSCAQGGTEVDLSGNGIDERYVTVDGGEAVGHERYPQPAAGSRAPEGALLFTAQTFTEAGSTSAVWVNDLAGGRRAVTSPTAWADYGRWIVDDYMLTGER